MRVPDVPGTVLTGFVDDQTKWNAYAACEAVLMPSAFESLSMVTLEAWAAAKPTLVNGACAVLVGQNRRAQGGLWYTSYGEFALALDRLLQPGTGPTLGRQGRRFVRQQCTWRRVISSYFDLMDS